MQKNTKISIIWGIIGGIILSGILYLFQVLGMWSFSAPIDFIKDKWYFMLPLVIGFGLQIGLYKAIKLKHSNVNKGVMVGGGTVSSGSMLACCMHNLVFLFPFLGLSGLAATFAIYQDWILGFSVLFMFIGLIYMIKKFRDSNSSCCK